MNRPFFTVVMPEREVCTALVRMNIFKWRFSCDIS